VAGPIVKSALIQVRVTREQKRGLERLARLAGLTFPDFLRERLLALLREAA
jgi:uncharacterized protein (DUF1778 family)